MCQLGFDVIQQVGWLLLSIVIIVFLIILIEVYEVGIATVIVAALPLRAVMGEVPWLSALEAYITSCIVWWTLSIGHMPSDCISSTPAPLIVQGMGLVYVHRDWLVIHPSWCIGRIVLGLLLSLSSSLVL